MSMSRDAVYIAISLMVGFFVSYHFYLKSENRKNHRAISSGVMNGVAWIRGDGYFAFAAICDAFIPSISLKECSSEKIRDVLMSIHPSFINEQNVLSEQEILKFKSFLCAGALEYGTHKQCLLALDRTATNSEKMLLSIVLLLLSTSFGSLVLTGYPLAFQDLPLWAREKALRSWRDSRIIPLRSLYHAFKRLVVGVYFSYAEPGSVNPAWDALQYEPTHAVKGESDFSSEEVKINNLLREKVSFEHVIGELGGKEQHDEMFLHVDAVVVGSGCGGGVVAHQLVEAGFKVLVLEKGGFYQTDDFSKWKECEAFTNAFDKGGLCTTADGSVVILAGSCVGGGSTVNWSASFVPPKHVLDDWAELGLTELSSENGALRKSLEEVQSLFNVNYDNSFYEEKTTESFDVNLNNKLLWKASQLLGFQPEKIPRNVKSCVNCGHCTHGCSHKSKQSTWNALLEPIILNQLNDPISTRKGKLFVIPNCFVEKVLFEGSTNNRKAKGVVATATTKGGINQKVNISAKVTISACGSIHTPALLLRSGCKHHLIGKHLSLHPVIGTGGMMERCYNTGLASGVSMGVVVKNPPIFSNKPDHNPTEYLCERYPVAIENPPVHMGILGLILPWESGLQLKIVSMAWKQFATFLGISRDKSSASNRVDIDAEGNPVIHYSVADHDKPNLLAGLEAQLRFQRAAGARAIFYGHSRSPWYVSSGNDDDGAEFELFLSHVRQIGIQPLDMQIFSAHQMSSCRMGSDSSKGPVSRNGSLYECKNLFVADGSVLPTSLGINPMLTIFAFAHMISSHVIEELNRNSSGLSKLVAQPPGRHISRESQTQSQILVDSKICCMMTESEGLVKLTEYLKQTRRQAEVAIDNLNGQIATLVQENEKLTKIIISLQQERDHFKNQLETLQQFNSNKAIFKERDDWRALVDSIQADRSRLQEENVSLQASLKQANDSMSELQKQTEYLQEEKFHLSTQLSDLEAKLQSNQNHSSPPATPNRSPSHKDVPPFILSPVNVKNGQQLHFFAESPRSIARQLKFELRKAYEQLEEERKVADLERAVHNEEISKLKGQLGASVAIGPISSDEKIVATSQTTHSNTLTQPSASWIGGFFSYFFQSNSNRGSSNMEVLTV